VVPVNDTTTLSFLSMYNQVYQNPSIGATLDQIQNLGSNFSYDNISDPNNPASTSFYKYNFDRITSDMEYVDLTSNLGNGWLYDGKIYTYAYYHLSRYTDDQGDFLAGGGYISGAEMNNGNGPDMNLGACQLSPTDPNTTSTCVPGQNFKNTYRSWGTIQRAEKDFNWGDIKTGIWYDYQTDTRFVQEIDLTDSSNPVNYSQYSNNGGQVTTDNDFGSIQRLQHNQLYTTQPYLQVDYMPIEALTLTGGFKYANFRRQLNAPVNQKTEVTQGFDKTWGKALPSFEAKYSFSPNLSVYAQVAQGFLAPNLNTFYTSKIDETSFQPETTWNYQTGFAYQDERLALGGDVYLVHFMDFIQSTGKGVNKIFINSGGAVYKGIEGEATYSLGYGLNIFANGGLNNANLTQGNAYISQVPQFTTNAGLIYSSNGIYASVIDQWTGGEYDGNGGAVNPKAPGAWYDPYNVVNLSGGYTFNHLLPHVSQPKITLNLLNITNQKQIIFSPGTTAGSGTPLYYTLPGVSAFVAVSVPITF
jgi:iron complex outermembrane receptor protein